MVAVYPIQGLLEHQQFSVWRKPLEVLVSRHQNSNKRFHATAQRRATLRRCDICFSIKRAALRKRPLKCPRKFAFWQSKLHRSESGVNLLVANGSISMRNTRY